MVSILTNLGALRVQRSLARASEMQSQTSERLSSGLRINHASDDAAGLAIAMGLRTDSRIYNQSIRNLNDGLSALAVAEGSAHELSNIITRLKELAEQSATGSYSNFQRSSLNNEAQQLQDEFSRLVSSTRFNGLRIIDDRTGSIYLQAGTTITSMGISLRSTNLAAGRKNIGTFTSNYNFSANTGGAVAVTNGTTLDLNGDGILDLATINSDNNISLMIGNGDGTFTAGTVYTRSAQGAVRGITSGDVNGDGNADLVITEANAISVLFSRGNGTVGSEYNYATTTAAIAQVGDVNGDGRADVVYGASGSTTEVLFGQSNGTITFGLNKSGGGAAVTLGDFNNDGKTDIITTTGAANELYFFSGNGNGTFQNVVTYAAPAAFSALRFGDYNGDGRLDVGAMQASSFTTYFGNGDGSFRAAVSTTLSFGLVSSFGSGRGDLNGDGRDDMIFSGAGAYGTKIALSNGDGTFSFQVAQTGNRRDGIMADFDGNGTTDFITYSTAVGGAGNVFLDDGQDTSMLNEIDLSTRSGALAALRFLGDAHGRLLGAIGLMGAEQSRIASALATLAVSRETSISAESRISSIDVAEESSNYVRTQILQQISASLLGQANQEPTLALTLLK